VSLSLKTLQPNPWDKVSDKFKEGSVINGVVHKLNPFGAFVKLDENITGLIHVSEFGSVEELKKELEPGVSYPFLIENINADEKRVILKLTGDAKKKAAATSLQKNSLEQNKDNERDTETKEGGEADKEA